jgi:homocitrate synthase NifV
LAGLRHELAYLGLQLTEDEERQLLIAVRSYSECQKTTIPAFTLLRLATSLIDERSDDGFRHCGNQVETQRNAA